MLITDFRGMDMSAMTELRNQLRQASVEYRVAKNTLMSRASEGTNIALLKEQFVGPCAVALSYDDPVSPARLLVKFAAGNPALEVKAGVVGDRVIDADGIERLSKLPSREVLLTQLVSLMNAPVTGLVRVLSGVPRSLLNVLMAIKEKKEGESETK